VPARWRSTPRILDANLNRAREAARVAEEYARFVQDSAEHSGRLKRVRHALRRLAETFGTGRLLAARDTPGDVGTRLRAPGEAARAAPASVAAAAFKRLEEGLRAIEEYAKMEHPDAATEAEALRYEVYAIESELLSPRRRVEPARLCVIVTGALCRGRDPAEVARAAIRGGAEMIQLREKELSDADLRAQAGRLREVTAELGALLIVNDRVDIAAASDADGVHLGPDDLPCADARELLGGGALIGMSAPDLAQARRAVEAGADYIGIGSVFPTRTKSAVTVRGTDYVREIAARIDIPAYAIGGINAGNVAEVVAAGGDRVAVCSAVISADDVEAAARAIRRQLPPPEEQGGSDE